MKRRTFVLAASAAMASLSTLRLHATSARAPMSPVLTKLVEQFAAGAAIVEGRVKFDVAPLVDNGNSVPIEVTVDSPMTADSFVTSIAVFNEKNPQHDGAIFTLTQSSGRARIATRIRLAISQQLVAVAKMNDGRCFTHTVDVLVTLASCLEDD
jgi:sulfur-oxidizing protein SoxY